MTNGGVRRPGSEANTSLGCVSLIPGLGPGNKADVHISKFCNLRNTEAGALPFHNLCFLTLCLQTYIQLEYLGKLYLFNKMVLL